jgi:uncharacterized protein (DUF58 family)
VSDPRRPSPATSITRWQVSPLGGYRVFGVFLIAVGLLIGRPDVAVLGVPLLLSFLWALVKTPDGSPSMIVGALTSTGDRVAQKVVLRPSLGVETVRMRVSTPGFEDVEAIVDVRSERELEVSLRTLRTGRADFFLIDRMALGPDSILQAEPERAGPTPTLLLPGTVGLRELPLPAQLQGVTGAHGSRRPGHGGDLRDVALFAPGDRLRRIDWRTTARRGVLTGAGQQLYVRRNFATADAHVMLVIDPYDIVGPDVSTWSSGRVRPDHRSSLDLAREAAVSMARHFLDQGDRVGLVDLGRQRRLLLPAGGRRHLHRLIHNIALSEAGTEMVPHHRAPQIPSGVMVVVFSTFLDDDPAHLARMWRHHGHRVIAIDVLPRMITSRLSPEARLAHRMVMMERSDRLTLLRMTGVEVVSWLEGDRGRVPDAPVATLAAVARAHRRHR